MREASPCPGGACGYVGRRPQTLADQPAPDRAAVTRFVGVALSREDERTPLRLVTRLTPFCRSSLQRGRRDAACAARHCGQRALPRCCPRLARRLDRCQGAGPDEPAHGLLRGVHHLLRLEVGRSLPQPPPEPTRTPRSRRTVRTGYAYQPPACCTYQRRRAACPGPSRTVRTGYAYQPRV